MPAGRPPKLEIDHELQGRIMTFVRAGAFPERAAVAAGVSERTHYYWQEKGLEERQHRESGKAPRKTWQVYLDYVDALDQAVAEAEMLLLGKVAQGGPQWNAAMTLLERRFRDRWSPKQAAKQPAATPTTPAGNVTPLQQMATRREQRSVKKTS
jgi:hypothetical protein